MAITDKTGINVASGFKLVAPVPLDARFIATDETDLQSFITNNAAYKGLTVWVDSLGKSMVYNGIEFVPVASGGASEGSIDTEHIADGAVTTDKLSEDVQDTLDQIGNIDEVLDEINGGGTTSGGGSSSGGMTLKSISETFDFSDTNEWEVPEDGLTSTAIGEATITKIQNLFNSLTLNPNIISGKLTLIGTINQIIGGLNFTYTALGNSEQMSLIYCSLCGLLIPNVSIQITIFYDTESEVYGINTTETSPLSGELKFDFYYYE